MALSSTRRTLDLLEICESKDCFISFASETKGREGKGELPDEGSIRGTEPVWLVSNIGPRMLLAPWLCSTRTSHGSIASATGLSSIDALSDTSKR